MHPMLNIAVKAARRAGNLIHRASDKTDLLTVTNKSHADFVSEVDRVAEQTIIQTLL
ncbi:MAG: inositol monophosphatase, partial [Gallionella sp.]